MPLLFSLRKFVRDYFVYLLPSAFIVYLILESYQVDFRPYYVAGKAVLLGLDPYLNHVGTHPDFYVPVNAEDAPWSGFVYPPFAALLFAPLGLLSYGTAKLVYSAIVLGVLWLLLFELIRQSKFAAPGEAVLFSMVSFPVLAGFERGQVDIPLCYLTTVGFLLFLRTANRGWPAFLFALSFCIKLFPGVAILYFLVKRDWKLVTYAAGWIALLFLTPIAYFGTAVYDNYLKQILPGFFGKITSSVVIATHGQGIVEGRVMSVDSQGLLASHDFVNGFMNPFLRENAVGSMLVGAIAFAVLLYFVRRAPSDRQFFSMLNCIHLFNPRAWIMGLIWYVPLFCYLYSRTNSLGKFILVLPLLFPPFTNANGMLAYAITLAFAIPAICQRLERLERVHEGSGGRDNLVTASFGRGDQQ